MHFTSSVPTAKTPKNINSTPPHTPTHLGEQRNLPEVVPRPEDAHQLVVLAHNTDIALADDVHLQAQVAGPESVELWG